MKSNLNKYLYAVCHALDLGGSNDGVSAENILKAGKWACGQNSFVLRKYQPTALRPVLETLKGTTSTHWFEPNELSLEGSLFPKNEKPAPQALEARVTALKKSIDEPDANLLAALQFHGSTLAVSESLADLPLYDHIKMTAAIAHCLENGNGNLRLAGGSISGIQSYLYDIVSKRAGKLLKGRSFYLQLLSDSLVESFLEEFDLSDCHVVYSSGGGFYVLMPDDDDVLSKFEDFKSRVTKQIYAEHKTNLFCEFAISDGFDENRDIDGKNGVWDELIKRLGVAKNKRLSYNSILMEDLLGFVDQGGADNEKKSKYIRDIITNEQILRSKSVALDDTNPETSRVSFLTKYQIDLGEFLRDAEFWITSKKDFHRNCIEDPLGVFHLLCKDLSKIDLPADAKSFSLKKVSSNQPFTFYGGNIIPSFEEDFIDDEGDFFKKGSPKTFDQLALGDRLDRLGILRMDVDNLGKIFSDHIGPNPSFARYAAVSRSLDWFFKGYLNEIHKQFFERTFVIYSGGDDLFIVGRWLEILEMAREIHDKFSGWSCRNLTLSGGLAILPSKFPVMHGAELAKEKEDTAKNYTRNNVKEKNAIAFFDRALNWENEMPIVFELKKQLEWLLDKKGGSVEQSILKKIDQHAESRKEQEKHGQSPRWIWNMIYDFGRFAGKTKNEKAANEIRDLAKLATLQDLRQKERAVPFLYLLQTAARWVELEDRTRIDLKTFNTQTDSDNN